MKWEEPAWVQMERSEMYAFARSSGGEMYSACAYGWSEAVERDVIGTSEEQRRDYFERPLLEP